MTHTESDHIMSKRIDVKPLCGHACIILSCGHTYDATPYAHTSLDALIHTLSRHIGKQQRCYKCESENEQEQPESEMAS